MCFLVRVLLLFAVCLAAATGRVQVGVAAGTGHASDLLCGCTCMATLGVPWHLSHVLAALSLNSWWLEVCLCRPTAHPVGRLKNEGVRNKVGRRLPIDSSL